jgi:hypothetical protein
MTASDQPADPAADRDPPARLPAAIPPGALTAVADPVTVVPALIADAGDAAGWRYVEFFTANIRNPHTRRAYARACSRFFCLVRGSRADADDDPAARCRHLYGEQLCRLRSGTATLSR